MRWRRRTAGASDDIAELRERIVRLTERMDAVEHVADRDARAPSPVCSFCGKPKELVKSLIAGPGVFICAECVELCNDIVATEAHQPAD